MTSERSLGRYTPQDVREHYANGLWVDENFTELLRARVDEAPDKVFVTDGTRSLTFAQTYRAAQRLAVGLRRKGVRSGDRVAVQLPNWAEFIVVSAALSRIGAVMVPVMPIYRTDEVAHVVGDAEVRVAVAPADFKGYDYVTMFAEIREASDTLESIIAVRSDEEDRADYVARGIDVLEDLFVDVSEVDADAELDFRGHPDDPFVIVYTSGTTSRPKGCLHTFNTYASSARALQTAFAHTSDDVQFGPSPITHSTGLVTSVLMPLLSGASTHLMAEWEPNRGLDEIKRFGCTGAVTATVFLQTLVAAAAESAGADLSSLRYWTCAGSPIPGAVIETAADELPGVTIMSLYGRSENLCTTSCTVADDPRFARISDGSALPGTTVKVVGPDGLEVSRGAEGDIAYRGPSHMLEYLNRPADTEALYTTEGYSMSGDLGVMDADGFVRVTGRTKDIIIRGGMNISVREVEDKLTKHPDILALALVAMPDERLGEKVCMYVVPKESHPAPDVASIRAYLTERGVAIQKTPERVEVVDALPMTATGKVQKHVLRKRIADAIAANE